MPSAPEPLASHQVHFAVGARGIGGHAALPLRSLNSLLLLHAVLATRRGIAWRPKHTKGNHRCTI